MRSVLAFPLLTAPEAEAVLDSVGERRELADDLGIEWVIDDALFVRLEEDDEMLWADWTDEEVHRFTSQLDQVPTWAVQIDLSAHVEGPAEVTTLLRQLLVRGGIALDDYSEHPWTLAEIESGSPSETRGFLRPA